WIVKQAGVFQLCVSLSGRGGAFLTAELRRRVVLGAAAPRSPLALRVGPPAGSLGAHVGLGPTGAPSGGQTGTGRGTLACSARLARRPGRSWLRLSEPSRPETVGGCPVDVVLTAPVVLSVADYQFSLHPPSMIAAASLAAALHGLEWTKRSGVALNDLLGCLQVITGIEKDYLQTCLSQIEGMVTSMMHESSGETCDVSKLEQLADVAAEHGAVKGAKAETPTDVQDIHF
ncbi:uncharacterized protein LOC113217066, partial [Frankliniella occidentalis]|uniref:Uncharacterized protein LOC113217066 n=1 Tax=Frankliniella occidentalis TaxID=133901 RepID=A0A6J1TIW0_FRAOC